MASNESAPKLPRLEMVNVPLMNSSGCSCFERARFTCVRASQEVRQGRMHNRAVVGRGRVRALCTFGASAAAPADLQSALQQH